jgi:hypothetical protein
MPYNNFSKYPNKVFIETGSYFGNGIQSALDSGFDTVISIEITRKYFEHCSRRFQNNPKVQPLFGDTIQKLPDVIKQINEPITFYLDGHWDTGEMDETRGVMDYPVIAELEIIKEHPIKNHTILIDDVRLFNEPWELGHETIVKKVLEINPDYKIRYEDGLDGRIGDVLVATVEG